MNKERVEEMRGWVGSDGGKKLFDWLVYDQKYWSIPKKFVGRYARLNGITTEEALPHKRELFMSLCIDKKSCDWSDQMKQFLAQN
jgi:hypothetical protein